MNKRVPLAVMLLLLIEVTMAQSPIRRCASVEVDQRLKLENPSYEQNRQQIEEFTQSWIASHPEGLRTVIKIPVVFHVVWNTNADNISDAQLQSQIDVLNEDFRKLNADASQSRFTSVAADCEFEFCLAQQDPTGAATNGIIRKNTSTTSFSDNDNVKKSSMGGADGWDRNSYLNIWVCDLSGGIIGYAQFPGGPASTDGVVLDYAYTGRGGSAQSPFDLGRSATHEVGHWLNCYHIWGDDGTSCNGSDLVSDTPNQADETYFCPYPSSRLSCSNPSPGDMYENFMDYTDDACMNTFTAGQKSRMQALFAAGGSRDDLLNSVGCVPPGGTTCDIPTGLSISSVTTTTATASWSAASGALSYTVRYKPSSSSTWTTIDVSGLSLGLTGLTANTQYDCKVKSQCNGTSSSYSSITNFTTLSGGGCTDNFEPNNGKNKAKAISVATDNTAIISSNTDNDWFSFSNTASQPNIRVMVTNLPADYDVKLFGTTATKVASGQQSGTIDENVKYNTSTVGTYKVQVFGYGGAFDPVNCYTIRVDISSSPFKTTGNKEFTSDKSAINLYPNPAYNNLMVEFNSNEGVNVDFHVYNMMGQLVSSRSENARDGHNMIDFELSQFAPGFYLLEMVNGDIVVRQKFEIVR